MVDQRIGSNEVTPSHPVFAIGSAGPSPARAGYSTRRQVKFTHSPIHSFDLLPLKLPVRLYHHQAGDFAAIPFLKKGAVAFKPF